PSALFSLPPDLARSSISVSTTRGEDPTQTPTGSVPPIGIWIWTEHAVHLDYIPYPATGYSSGDAAWQLTAATLVGLMSLPGLAVLYGGLVQKKWAVNTMLMAFSAFSLVLIVWALWAFNMGFGHPWIKTTVNGSPSGFLGKPGPALGAGQEGQADIPL